MLFSPPKLKVTIADSSSFSRLVLSDMVQTQPDLEVLDTATDGRSLMDSLRRNRPDVVLAHLDLPQHSRDFFIRRVQQDAGVPVLMLLENSNSLENTLLEVKTLGVFDYVIKPKQRFQPRFREVQGEILDKIRSVRKPSYTATFSAPAPTVFKIAPKLVSEAPENMVVIGASTGGTQALEKIVARLNKGLDSAVLVAVHLPAGFTRSFAQRLQTLTPLKVVEGKAGMRLEKGKIIVAPGGQDMIVQGIEQKPATWRIAFAKETSDKYDSPSVDALMRSVAKLAGPNTLGILLTGMGNDGTKGLQKIKQSGGQTLAQDQATSAIFGMAKSAIEKGFVQHVQGLQEIPGFINKFVAAIPVAG